MAERPSPAPPSRRAVVALAYAVLYVVWGSTYLAMREVTKELPPLLAGAARFGAAGGALVAVALALRARAPTRAELGRAAVVGFFLLVGGNGLVMWAVGRVGSGVTAVMVALTPLWMTLLGKQRISRRGLAGLALGLLGIVVLVGPNALAGTGAIDVLGAAALAAASLSWSFGSLLQTRGASQAPAVVTTAIQLCAGSFALAALGAIAGEDATAFARASTHALAALAYLIVGGSLIAYTCYTWLLRVSEPRKVASYAYVNPVIAVFLGATVGNEPLPARVVLASFVIVLGVVLIVGDEPAASNQSS